MDAVVEAGSFIAAHAAQDRRSIKFCNIPSKKFKSISIIINNNNSNNYSNNNSNPTRQCLGILQ